MAAAHETGRFAVKRTIVALMVLACVLAMGTVSGFAEDDISWYFGERVYIELDLTYEDDGSDNYHTMATLRTNAAYNNSNPVWSPDGNWIAYSAASALWIISPDGGEPVVVAYHDPESSDIQDLVGSFEDLCFSADSQKIIYRTGVYDESKGGYTEVNDLGNTVYSNLSWNIESININTKEKATLIEGGFYPSFSADGRYLAYVNFDSRIYSDPLQAENNLAPAILDTETGEKRILTKHNSSESYEVGGFYHPTFSPDGSHLILGYNYQLYKIPFEGGDPEQLTFYEHDDQYTCMFTRFSPDGEWVMFVYSKKSDYNHNILLYNVEKGITYWKFNGGKFLPGERRGYRASYDVYPPEDSWLQSCPNFSPDGSKHVLLLKEPVYNELLKTTTDAMSLYTCNFVPAIYFIKKDHVANDVIPPEFGEEVLFDYDHDTLNRTEYDLTFEDQYRWNSIDWSPDGKWLALGGTTTLSIVPADGGQASLINSYDLNSSTSYHNKLVFQDLKFSPDGRHITYRSQIFDAERGSKSTKDRSWNYIPSIESIDIFTGEREIIVPEGRNHSFSSDGRYIVFIYFDYRVYTDPTNKEHHKAPAIYDTVTGETHFLTDDNLPNSSSNNDFMSPCFSPDNSHIIAIHQNQICKIPFEGGEVEFLTDYDAPEEQVHISPKYSSDGNWIVFSRLKYGSTNDVIVFDVKSKESYYLFGKEEYVPDSVSPYSFEFGDEETLISQNYSHSGWGLGSQVRSVFSPGENKLAFLFTKPKLWWNDKFIHGTVPYIADFDPARYASKPISVETATAPAEFAITGSYPNPFNPSTMIEFSVPETGMGSLAIYNSTGQKIREIVSAEITAGKHATVWDGRDADGNAVSSGVYIARLKAGNFVAAKQMMLMK